jgi:hypothetical protein
MVLDFEGPISGWVLGHPSASAEAENGQHQQQRCDLPKTTLAFSNFYSTLLLESIVINNE